MRSIRTYLGGPSSISKFGGHRRRWYNPEISAPEGTIGTFLTTAGWRRTFEEGETPDRFPCRSSPSRSLSASLPVSLSLNVDHSFYEKLVHYSVFGEGAAVFGRHVDAHFLINEVFMVFFFGIATKEITDSILPGGALNPARKAINPLMGTFGGVLGPAGLYFLLAFVFYGGTDDFSVVANGWGIPTATDIALAWLVARLVFGRGHPARQPFYSSSPW